MPVSSAVRCFTRAGDVNGTVIVYFLATFVLCCEFVGGMTSVALSDAVQMSVMGTSFILMLFIMLGVYGGPSCHQRGLLKSICAYTRHRIDMIHRSIDT